MVLVCRCRSTALLCGPSLKRLSVCNMTGVSSSVRQWLYTEHATAMLSMDSYIIAIMVIVGHAHCTPNPFLRVLTESAATTWAGSLFLYVHLAMSSAPFNDFLAEVQKQYRMD